MSETPERCAIKKMRDWEKEQADEAKRREDKLVKQLLALVPDCLSKWKAEAGDMVIKDLIEFGIATRKYCKAKFEADAYGYTDLNEFSRRFTKLKKAWEGIVEIQVTWPGNDRFEVFCAPIEI